MPIVDFISPLPNIISQVMPMALSFYTWSIMMIQKDENM